MKIDPHQGKTVKFKNNGDKRRLLKAEKGREEGTEGEMGGERKREKGKEVGGRRGKRARMPMHEHATSKNQTSNRLQDS